MQGVSPWALALLILSAVTISKQDDVPLDCQPGWKLMGVQCYKLYTGIIPWESAAKVCKSYGAELAKVTDFFENQEIGKFAVEQNTPKYWIGFTRTEAPAGDQVIGYWSDGEPTSTSAGFWENDQPNDDMGKCVYAMQKGMRYFWSFGPCEAKMPYVCQRPACPQGSNHCINGRCINPGLVCDGEDDCGDSSDEMNCATHCTYYLEAQSGNIATSNYPGSYSDAQNCQWVIKVPLGQNAYLRFTNFTTEPNNDIVQVLVGGLTEARSQVVGVHSGDLSGNLPDYTSPNNFIMVKFSSDSATTYLGFRAEFSGRTANLQPVQTLVATDDLNTLTPPNYPSMYLGGQDYTWVIKTQRQTSIITLNILEVDLKGSDMLLIRDGDSVEDNLLYKFKADTKVADVPYILSTGNSIYITMQTRGFKVGKGFRIMYKQGCEMLLTANSGHIFSPGYPLDSEYESTNYPNQIECTYRVNVPGSPTLTLKSMSFETQLSKDVVTVHSGGSSPDILSGTRNTNTDYRNAGQFNITFKSDAIITMRGFSFMYSIDCPNPNFNDKTVLNPAGATWVFGSLFTVTCMQGYRLASQEYKDLTQSTNRFVSLASTQMQCLAGGKWNVKTTPNCQPMYCGPAPLVQNAYTNSSEGQASSVGGSVTYECYSGFTRTGSAEVTCGNDGTWGPQPSCTIASCPLLTTTIASGSSNITVGDGRAFGSIVVFTCDPGYQIVGEPILFCTSNSTWTSSVPSCIRKNCPEPPIRNGKFDNRNMAFYGDTRNVVCDNGFLLTGGSNPIRCEADQTFSNLADMKCEDRDECATPGICAQQCQNSVGSYSCSCSAGFTLNADKRTCDDILECSMPNRGGCSQNCVEEAGSYSCRCNNGYELFTANGQLNYTIPTGETGTAMNDIYRLQHTCVRIQCADPPELNNGVILTKRRYHRFEDHIIMACNIGYNFVGPSVRVCQANGQWSGAEPVCSRATCPAESVPNNLKNQPTVTPSGDINYMEFVNITCNLRGTTFMKQRQCLLNPVTKTYGLEGAEYECGVIDCGVPEDVPGAVIPDGVQTVAGSNFTFTCKNLYTMEGTSSLNNSVVVCKDNGYWGWNTLRCIGKTCKDPGRPVDGTQHATTYEEGKQVNYTCDRPGYTIVGNPTLTCLLNAAGTDLNWNFLVPTCADTQKPTFAGCIKENTVSRFTVASVAVTIPTATDNTAIKSMTVTPTWPSSSVVIVEQTTFVFEAEDFNGNKATCSSVIKIKDEIPPAITCTGPIVIPLIDENDFRFTNFTVGSYITALSDNSGETPNVTFNPPSFNMSGSFIGTSNYKQWIRATARDSSGNEKSCRFQIMVEAAVCSPLSLPTPVHGKKSCAPKPGNAGYTCNLTCDDNYAFHEQSMQDVVTTSCNTGSGFDLPTTISACSFKDTASAKYTQVFSFNYLANPNTPLSASCSNNIASAAQDVMESLTTTLRDNYCSTLNPKPTIEAQTINSLTDVEINNTTRRVHINYTLVYTDSGTTNLQSCAKLVFNVLADNNFEATKRMTGESSPINPQSCPSIIATGGNATNEFQGFSCLNGVKLVERNNQPYCLSCPKGYFNSGGSTCKPCPRGQFNNMEGGTQCQDCPPDTWTYKTGAPDSSFCLAMCDTGTTSVTRLPPCQACPLNSYWLNSTNCQNCPSGSITRDLGSIEPSECKAECGTGTYNAIDGHENCNQCPKNFYQDQRGQTTCKQCSETEVTANIGSQSRDNCTAASGACSGFCQNSGICRTRRHSPFCECPDGYSGERCETARNSCASSPCMNGGTCNPTGALNFTCSCPPGTSGLTCETDLNDCPEPLTAGNNPCQNGGMCQDQLNSYKCLCKDGFTGDLCSSPQPICTSQPCINGNCAPIGSFRRECTCSAGYTGPDCDINIDDCAENPCLHGGRCEDQVNGYNCRCRIGFTGSRCETRLNKCEGVTCGNQGMCVEDHLHDTYRCICNPDAAYGEYCDYVPYLDQRMDLLTFSENSTKPNLVACKQHCDSQKTSCGAFSFFSDSQHCLLHSTRIENLPLIAQTGASYYVRKCSHVKDDFYTEWFNAWSNSTGSYLSLDYLRNTLQLSICGGNVPLAIECQDATTKMASANAGTQCTIATGFVCDNSAQTSGSCQQHEIRFKCAVTRITQENTCSIPPVCDSSPCVNGNCRVDGLTFACDCNLGYGGSLCQNNLDDCASSPCLNGGTCTDGINQFLCSCPTGYTGQNCGSRVDYCSNGPCNLTGSFNCTNSLGGAVCYCRPGYTGSTCAQNIQECISNPCLHDGECTDAIDGFICKCKPGWTGSRCESLIRACNPASPCQNNAQCYNLFSDYFCQCKANTYGQNCQFAPSVCKSANPCVHGTCTESAGVTSCMCGQDYTGDGCEIQVDHCAANTCKNKGTCSVPSLNNYKCTCPEGFSGPNCNVNIDNCAGVMCRGNGSCIDGVNEYFCRCPVGMTGFDCDRVLDRNYDMLFELPQKTGHAYLPYPIRLNTTKLSVVLWVRYWKPDDTGTFFTMYSVDGPNSLSGKKELIRIDHSGLTISIGGTPKTYPPRQLKINNGRWYQVTVTWNSETGLLRFVTNTISQTIMDYQKGATLDTYVWMVLGSRYDPVKEEPVMYEGFNGWLSQVALYERDLTFTQEIPLKYEEPQKFFAGEIFAWNEFRRSAGVSVVIPSTAKSTSCPRGYSGISCQTPNERKLVVYPTNCPKDIIKLGTSRITRVTWTDPNFAGSPTNIVSTAKSGDVFGWDRHLVVYVASNMAGNMGLCSFKIFVQYSNCTRPENPYQGSALEDRARAPLITNSIQCNPNYETVRPVPKLYTCPRIGHYNPLKKFNTFKFPPCGRVINNQRKKVFAQLFYRIVSTFCSGIQTVATTEVRNAIRSLNAIWGKGLCGVDDCTDVIIVVNCQNSGRRKRQTILNVNANVTLPTAKTEVTDGVQTLSPEDVLQLAILNLGKFNFSQAIPGAVPMNDLLQISSSLSCEAGQTVVDGKCVSCAPGTFYNAATLTCDSCPVGQYQPSEGATSCFSCGVKITELPGATSSTDCKDNCTAGQKFDEALNTCVDCPIGFYQNLPGQFYCEPCSVEKTTRSVRSTSINDCYVGCGKGEQLGQNATCEKCAMGKYRDASMPTCEDCPAGLTTTILGADDVSKCDVGDCLAGSFRNNTYPKICERCPKGTYQSQTQQYTCTPCGNTTYDTTLTDGASSREACKFICPDGQEVHIVQGVKACFPCKVGFFRNATVMLDIPYCSPCLEGTTTRTNGSINPDDCSELNCPIGKQPNAANTRCEDCPIGTYQDQANQQNCKPCSGQTSTRSTGANSTVQCESYCPGGEEKLADGSCRPCPIGFYKDNTQNFFMMCTRCPDDNTVTATIGTDSAAKCTVRGCQAGYKRKADDSGCDPCPIGEYQPLPYQKTCMKCPIQTSTRQNAADNGTKCESYCQPGYQKDASGQCQPCSRGYFKDNAKGLFGNCELCPSLYITSSTAATSVNDCSVANCSAGYKTENNACVACPIGYYQAQKWEPDCDKCPTDKTTVNTSSTAESDCILSCPPGKEDIGGNCSLCKIGYYKEEQKAALCTQCPTNKTTTIEGADNPNACNIVGCPAGFRRISTTDCEECEYGFYQPEKFQTSCKPCDVGTTTFTRGAKEAAECLLDCPVGQQYNSGSRTCEPCPQGYYQDKTKPQFPMCIICGDPERITPGPGAVSAANCTIQNCTTPGQFLNATTNQCQDCPVGTYQDTKWQTSCKSCLGGFTTRNKKSPSSSSCVRDCPLGQKQVGDSCMDCGTGYYRDGSTWNCIQCPDGLSTTSVNAASLTDCNVSPCKPGNYFERQLGRCQPCPKNTYQTEGSKFQCDGCPSGKFTTTVGSQSPDDCKGFCDVGSNCSPNAVCEEDPTTRFKCTCKDDFIGNGINCTHKCDTDYCQSGSTCYRGPPASCQCTEFYKGDQCETRRPAELVSDQNTLTIVGIVIGVLGFLLLLILIAACLYRRRRPVPDKRTPSEYDDRTSLARGPYDYPLAYVPSKAASVVSGTRYMLPQHVEKSYDNPTYVMSGNRTAFRM